MLQYWDQLLHHLDRTRRLKQSRVQQILEKEPSWAERPEQMLVHHGLLTREELLQAKSEMMRVPLAFIDPARLDPAIVWIVPQAMAQRYHAVCIGREGDRIHLAMVDPNDAFATDYVQMRTGYEIDRFVAYAGDIEEVIATLYASGPPVGSAPVSIRDRVGMEVVRGRTMETVPSRPRTVELGGDIPETETRTTAERPILTMNRPRVSLGGDGATLPMAPAVTPGLPRPRVTIPLTRPDATDRVGLELARLNIVLTSETDEDRLIDKMLDTAMALFHTEAASLLLIDWATNQLYFREARGPGQHQVLKMALPLDPDTSVAAWCVANRKPANIPDVTVDPRHFKAVDEEVGYETRSLLAVPVLWGDDVLGVIELLNKEGGPFTDQDVEHTTIMAAQVALALHNTMAMAQLHNFYQQSIETLIDCYQAYDPVSRDHVVEVASMATAMAREMGLTGTDLEILSYAGLLHDIGKIRCPDPHDAAHAELGAGILSQVTLFGRLIPVVRYHHERWDGSGPAGLAGEDIPPLARVLAVAEAWFEEVVPRISEGDSVASLHAGFLARFGHDFDPALRGPFEASLAVAVT